MRIACAQMEALSMDRAAEVWPIAADLAHQAASQRADLLIYPEIAYPSYFLESPERYQRSDILRSGEVLERYSRLAAGHGLWLVAGFVEEKVGVLYNSAAILDRRGAHIGTARKQFMWDCDRQWFTPGAASTVYDTEFGTMGVLICADLRMPEIMATLATCGAEFVVQPTAWVNGDASGRTYRNIQPDFLVRARACEFGLSMASSSKSGRDGDAMGYVGQSRIVDAGGKLLVTAGTEGSELVIADIAPAKARIPMMTDHQHRRLMNDEPPFRAEPTNRIFRLDMRHSIEHLSEQLKRQGARTARCATSELDGFATARCAALDGVQVLLADGRATDDAPSRARAAENRMFVIVISGDSAQFAVDPMGRVFWRRVDVEGAVRLEPGQADCKAFTPTTDLWSQRRVRSYRFTAD